MVGSRFCTVQFTLGLICLFVLGFVGTVPARAQPFEGTDICLGMEWEPTIAVDPHNPTIIAVASFSLFTFAMQMQISFDGGRSFTQTITPPMIPGLGGDPVLAFDSQGRLFFSYLCLDPPPPPFTVAVCITGYEIDDESGQFVPIAGINWPVNVNAAAGHGAPNIPDKEWLAADSFSDSPFADRLYVIWTDTDEKPTQMWTTYSDDQGATWSDATLVDGPDEGPLRAFAHIAVAPNGDVYLAYHVQLGFIEQGEFPFDWVPDGISGKIVLRRSQDGGETWDKRTFPYEAGEADMTFNMQHNDNGVIPGARFMLVGSTQPWVVPDPFEEGRIYVVVSDDPDNDVNSGDAADVFIVISEDHGQTWSDPIRVDSGPEGTFQVMPTAAVDPLTGTLVVTYYDNRALETNPDGNYKLDLLAAYSVDGGLTWLPEVDFNDGLFDPDATTSVVGCPPDGAPCCCPVTTRIGEYNGVAFGNSNTYVVWADNSCTKGDVTMLDTFFDQNPVPCPADLDGDGSVGILDLLALLAAWGTDPGGPPDFDGDGTVGILDLLTLLANWGPC